MNPINHMIECPIDVKWKFHRADLLELKDSENGYLNGKIYYAYKIPGVQYSLSIYPNGNSVETRGKTRILLFVNGSEERNITANFTTSIKAANYNSKEINHVYQKTQGHGTICAKTDEFVESKNKYFFNGEITIGIKGSLKVARPTIRKISTPISMEWIIKESDLKVLKKSNNGNLRSKRFIVSLFSDITYYLQIYPNGNKEKNKGKIWIYLHLEIGSEKKEIEAVYDFSILSANYYKEEKNIYEKSCGWGNSICSTDDLFDPEKNFIVDGYLTINLNGILMAEYTTAKLKNGFAIQADQKKKDKEFTIIVDGKEINVHKKLLIDASPVFARMFESGMKEAIENKMDIPDFTFEIVDAAIKLCYSSAVPRNLRKLKFTIEDMFMLYKFADKYEIKLIMDLAEKYLAKKMSGSNVCQLIEFSKEMNITKLHENCVEFLMKCSKEATPVYGADVLDKYLVFSMFLKSLCPKAETDK